MTAGNSDIADLSDPDRPMKLAEKYGNIYDDEWTDAYLALTETHGQTPKDAIDFLLVILKKGFDYCKELSIKQLSHLAEALLFPNPRLASQAGQQSRLQSADRNELLAVRRKISAKSGALLAQPFLAEMQMFMEENKENKALLDQSLAYILKVIDVCWQMVLHNPPMHIAFELTSGDTFDPQVYNSYGKSGDKYDFLVWPPLFVSVNGGLLSKGTAQPIPGGKKPPKKK